MTAALPKLRVEMRDISSSGILRYGSPLVAITCSIQSAQQDQSGHALRVRYGEFNTRQTNANTSFVDELACLCILTL